MEERIQELETAIRAIQSDLKTIGDVISTGFKKVDINFESVGKEIRHLHGQIDVIHKKVDLLRGDTTEGFEDVGAKLDNLTEEITKIGTVTHYDEYFKNMKSIRN